MKIIRSRCSELAKAQKKYFTTGDPESVHDLRVALRRLQALLERFEDLLPRKKISPYRKTIRKALRRLGSLRELDIIIEALDLCRKDLPPEEGNDLFLLTSRYTHNRKQQERSVTKETAIILRKLDLADLKELIKQHHRKHGSDVAGVSGTFLEYLYTILSAEFSRLLEHGNAIFNHADNAALLHELRIDAKPFRYLFEIAAGMVPDLKEEYEVVKTFVGALGEIHDADTFIPVLRGNLAEIQEYNLLFGDARGRIAIGAERRILSNLLSSRRQRVEDCTGILQRWKSQGTQAIVFPSLSKTT
ncbi:MAG: CHAD domain-containing protein [Bacteroidota bacterium]